ncbi:hypothetical protein YC2023_051784 [Brassica napus]
MDEHNRNPFASASGRAGGNTSASSNSSFSSSVADTDDDQTIARMLAEDESLRRDGRLGKRLSLEQAISVCHGKISCAYHYMLWAGQALFGTLTPDIVVLTLLYNIAGVLFLQTFMRRQSNGTSVLPVAFGTEAAKWICVNAIDVTQLFVAVFRSIPVFESEQIGHAYMKNNTYDFTGDRTQNLWFRRPAPYPLGHEVIDACSFVKPKTSRELSE